MKRAELNMDQLEKVCGGMSLTELTLDLILLTMALLSAEEAEPAGASGGW